MTTTKLETITQCKSCPWRVDCVPDADIPNYRHELHENLRGTCPSGLESAMPVISGGAMRIMACHYSKPAKEFACAGWLSNQLGPGNNIGVRLLVSMGRLPIPEIDGDQHETFEDTLPQDTLPRAPEPKTTRRRATGRKRRR